MKSRTFVLLYLLLMILNQSCTNNFINPPPEEQLVIHCVLLSSQQRQKALISQVVANDQNAYETRDDVSVFIDSTPLKNIDTGESIEPYNFYTDSLLVSPGDLYTLTVTSADFGESTGEVAVPGPFEIIGLVDSLTVAWTRSQNAFAYSVSLYDAATRSVKFRKTVLDTMLHLPNTLLYGEYILEVKAVESNYYAYFVEKKLQAGLKNAVGVFAAITTRDKLVSISVKPIP